MIFLCVCTQKQSFARSPDGTSDEGPTGRASKRVPDGSSFEGDHLGKLQKSFTPIDLSAHLSPKARDPYHSGTERPDNRLRNHAYNQTPIPYTPRGGRAARDKAQVRDGSLLCDTRVFS